MDSSRSGLLSTLLMTLPLIVVPAVALLRPPGQAGISTSSLDASEDEGVDSLFDFDGFDTDPSGAFKKEQTDRSDADDLDRVNSKRAETTEGDIFKELDSGDDNPRESSSPRGASPRVTAPDPFFNDEFVTPPGKSANKRPADQPSEFTSETDPEKPDSKQIVEQLNALGALKTMWFDAGDKTPVGLAVFFRGETDQTRIRFEAVGQSRNECAAHVLEQVNRWQQQNP